MMRLGLRMKLLLAISLPIVAVAAFSAVHFPRQQQRAAHQALVDRATGVSQVLAVLVTTAVDLDAAKDAETQLASVEQDAALMYVVVLKADGSVFARFRTEGAGQAAEHLEPASARRVVERSGLLHVGIPLTRDDGSVVGSLVAGFSRASIDGARRQSQRTALGFGVAILVVGVIVAWLLSGGIARPLLRAAEQLTAVSSDLVGAAREQEASAAEGAAAVEETRRTMEMLVGSAQQISDSCSEVLGNAERSLGGNRQVAERIAELNGHAEKVAEILASIMQVADRTDLLALNAALEGTKAGEAGKGFTLVAAEMRRLAENVMESVAGIRRLMKDVRAGSQGAVDASHAGIRLSEATTSSARDIALVTQQQRKATEQVSTSMDEMTQILNHNVTSIEQTAKSAGTLADLSAHLSGLVSRARGRVVEPTNGQPLRRRPSAPRTAAAPSAAERRPEP